MLRKAAFYVLVIFGSVAIVMAACGFCFKCCESKTFAVTYGFCLIPAWAMMVAFGIVSFALIG